MPIFVGDVSQSEYQRASVKHVKHIRETAELHEGDIVEFFGHVLRWDENCVAQDTCRQYVLIIHTNRLRHAERFSDGKLRGMQLAMPLCH